MADPGFSSGGGANSQVCVILPNFHRKLHENERIWMGGVRVPGAPLDPPMLTLLINKLADLPPSFHIPARMFSQMIKIFCTSSFNEQADSKQASNYTRNMKLSYSDRYMDILWYWPLESKFTENVLLSQDQTKKVFLFVVMDSVIRQLCFTKKCTKKEM